MTNARLTILTLLSFLSLLPFLGGLGACDREPVDRFRELELVDDEIVGGPRAKNAGGGAFSFRHVAVSLSGSEDAASADLHDTLAALGPATAREVLCPWLRETAANGCDEACGACRARRLDLSRAPMRLLAISNRVDLGDEPGALSEAGEGRFVYGVTRGPGDDPASAPRKLTVIVEYALPPTRSPAGWAEAWHALGALEGEAYLAALEDLTREITGARSLAQIRINAAPGEPDPGMRELALDAEGRLRERPLAVAQAALPATKTCAGCHGEVSPVIDDAFHVSPLRAGRDKLSRFLHDPAAPREDDLARREVDLRARLAR